MLTSCDRVNVFDERCRDHTTYETLFRRSASQDRQSRPRRRYLQVRNRSPVRCEPLSSVKRYVRISDWGASLTSRKGGGRPPKVDQSTSQATRSGRTGASYGHRLRETSLLGARHR